MARLVLCSTTPSAVVNVVPRPSPRRSFPASHPWTLPQQALHTCRHASTAVRDNSQTGRYSRRTPPLIPAMSSDDDYTLPENEIIAPDFEGLKVFVAGASGKTGREIVKALAMRGVKVRALARDPTAAAKVLPGLDQGVEVVKGDVFKFQTLPPAIDNCNVIICATGSASFADPFGPFNVDYEGTKNLVAAARMAGVQNFVYVSSIGADDILFPLNLAWGVLFWKKRAEEAIQRSGIPYTIVRPGGLMDEPRGETAGNVIMKGADAFGLPPREQPGSILRSQVQYV
mmetsp:Transcript_31981/g.57269  ORF Transcript_31981/g.57269 Transcript_31981/m.57269 type:complete len:286 (-) Transcript_31981:430-1287(-)